MWVAEWSPDSGVEDQEFFEAAYDANTFVEWINSKKPSGRGMSSYWYVYEYKLPTTVTLEEAKKNHV